MVKFFLSLLFIALPLIVHGQLKVGYVNPQEVLAQLPETEIIQKKLQDYLAQKEREMQQKQQDFQKAMTEYQTAQESLTDQQRKDRERQLNLQNQELTQFRQTAQGDIQRRQNELLAPIIADVNNAIREVATELNLDFVFNQASSTGENFVLYVDQTQESQLNLTEKVIAKLN